jgi:hypothetical protein
VGSRSGWRRWKGQAGPSREAEDAAEPARRALGRQAAAASRPVDPLEEEIELDLTSTEELLSSRTSIHQLKTQIQVLEARLLPEHSTMVAARAQYARLNRRYLTAVVQRGAKADGS